MQYSELNNLWIEQTEQYKLWRNSLIVNVEKLRSEVMTLLQPPRDVWIDINTKEQHRYVELYHISDNPRPIRGGFSDDSFTENNELVFGISVTFEHGSNAYPKQVLNMPVAVKFSNKIPEFAFVNCESKLPEGSWYSDVGKFAESMITKMLEYLRYDPFVGVADENIVKRTSIGFIPNKFQPETPSG